MKSTDQGTPSMYGLLVASHRTEPARSPRTARTWTHALGWTAVAIAVVLLFAGCAAAPSRPGPAPAGSSPEIRDALHAEATRQTGAIEVAPGS